jgi:ribose 5-phosphate isomerase B
MKVAIGSDHRGFLAKEHIKRMLTQMGHEVQDFGTTSDASTDYPDYAVPVCKAVLRGEAARGILLCGSGIGMCMTANKVPGIRAALCHDELTAEMSRRHNDANVLCLGADLLGEELMRRMVGIWMSTGFDGGRHERRVKKIMQAESVCVGDGPAKEKDREKPAAPVHKPAKGGKKA